MSTFWASWWSGNYADEGCTAPPFKFWVSGERDRGGDSDRTDESICAVVVSDSEAHVEALARKHFPDAEMRFCEVKPDGWRPSRDRFPD